MTVIVARLIGKVCYGEYGVVLNTLSMFGILGAFGIGSTATKYIAELRNVDRVRAGRIAGLANVITLSSGFIVAVVVLCAAPWLARGTLAAPHLALPLQIGAMGLLCGALNTAQYGVLAGFEAFGANAVIGGIAAILGAVGTLLGAMEHGVTGAVAGQVIAGVVSLGLYQFAINSASARAGVHIRYRDCWKEAGVIWGFGVPALLGGLMTGPVNWLCIAMIANEKGGYNELGAYHAANQWFSLMQYMPSLVCSGFLPVLSERFGQEDFRVVKKTFRYAIPLMVVTTFPLAIGLTAASRWIMALYGADFRSGYLALVLCAWTACLWAISVPVGALLAAADRMWLGFFMNFAWAVVYVTCTFVLRSSGAEGLSLARLVAYVFHAGWSLLVGYYILSRVPIVQEKRQLQPMATLTAR